MHSPNDADDLGRSYAALMQSNSWESETPPTAEPTRKDSSMPPAPLRIVEALLFVGGTPLTAQRAWEIVRGLTADQFTEVIDALNRTYRRQNRPYFIQALSNGYMLTLKPKYRALAEKLHAGPREARLSTAAIDVLALTAYR